MLCVCVLCPQGGRFRGLTMGFPPLPQRSSARRSFGRSKRLSLARSLDDLEVGVFACMRATHTHTHIHKLTAHLHLPASVQCYCSFGALSCHCANVAFEPHVHRSLNIATCAHCTSSHEDVQLPIRLSFPNKCSPRITVATCSGGQSRYIFTEKYLFCKPLSKPLFALKSQHSFDVQKL